ncbi:MAG TPA: ABC transporter permease, partial [Gaiellaceae bacterium]|nr:ABC transporter permease [Gaiellaceae bacterium]
MTTLAHRETLRGPAHGGIAARRALVHWAWRLFRREWRQQILVVTLLTVAVAAAIGSVTVAYNSGADRSNEAEFGSADQRLSLDGGNPRALAATLPGLRQQYETIDIIGHRSLAVPGAVEQVEFRSQDPRGPYGGPRLALHRGNYPEGRDQVAVTDGVANLLGLEIGETLSLDGGRRTVVGIVENPADLSDEFALVSPSSAGPPDHVSVLAKGDGSRPDMEPGPAVVNQSMRGNDNPADELLMFSVATIFLLLASLVAAAGFAVIAQRRLRQLGMLAAIGATEKHLRLVVMTNGAVVGAIGALIGSVVGLALWLALVPTLETALDHRLDRLSLPWMLLGSIVLLAVVGATAAAWWPGRAVARVPVMLALSARPLRPKPAHRSAIVAAALIAAGIGSLAFSNRDRAPLIIAGLLAVILGTLLLGPLAIRIFARAAGHAPIAPRLALRDLARYQARSGAALAAITLALGIAAAVVVTAAAEEKKDDDEAAATLPNLSDRQIRVYTGETSDPELLSLPLQTPAQLTASAARVRQLAAGLGQATVIPLRKAIQPGDTPLVTQEGDRALVAVSLSKQTGPERWSHGSSLYVATPALLRYLGIDPATVDPSADFLADPTVPTDKLMILGFRARDHLPVTNVQRIDSRHVLGSGGVDIGSAPSSFVTLSGLRRHGWKQVPSGWLVESGGPLTSEQIDAARELAAGADLTIETQREGTSLATPIAIATAAGALLALVILAMTVGLIRSESAGDLRTLTATGATGRIRRTLTAATAGALALLGALLGVAGAYLALAATYHDDLGHLGRIPVLS